MTRRKRATVLAFAIAISACAPSIDGPIDHQRAIDRDER